MHQIDHISVTGFWGQHQFATPMNPDVTFFIGVNGTGKTTLLNLVAAALSYDFYTLDQIPFKEIEILLSSPSSQKKPSIIVKKKVSRQTPFSSIDYIIRDSQSSKPINYSLDEFYEQRLLRRRGLPSRQIRQLYRQYVPGLIDKLNDLVQITWLSIHRSSPLSTSDDEPPSNSDRTFDSTIDRKIHQINNSLVRHFSTLSRQKDEEVLRFQEAIFLSLIEKSEQQPSRSVNSMEESKQDLFDIFNELHVSASKVRPTIDEFFHQHEITRQKLQNERHKLTPADFEFLVGLPRIENMIQLWRKLQARINEIFDQRNRFIDTLNSMFYRKTAEIGDSGEITFVSKSKKTLSPFMLSSGEKQLFILFSETLLQKNQPFVFLADEPELSLHVRWQERLLGGIRSLNESAQIIMATHSPDIIGPYGDKTIDMESLIQ